MQYTEIDREMERLMARFEFGKPSDRVRATIENSYVEDDVCGIWKTIQTAEQENDAMLFEQAYRKMVQLVANANPGSLFKELLTLMYNLELRYGRLQ